MGIFNTWTKGFTGKGIVIAIVDDGIDTNHTDLADNYNLSLSTNIIRGDDNPSHRGSQGHGTNCAGIAVAVRNDKCIVGVAYDATLSAIRLLDDEIESTATAEALAVVYKLESIDIYSSSWGPTDDGAGFEASDTLSEIQEQALIHGVTMGRDGKGSIYVWASGNGGENGDDCNVDGYSSSMYTVSIGAVRPDGSSAWYAEQCTSLMAVTYSGDKSTDGIATTAPGDRCTDDFEGTSAACPMAAGIIALVLEANPNLSWRDVQHLIVENSTKEGLNNANFIANGAGKRVSVSHGFGMLNAELLVDSATTWKTVPKRIRCSTPASNITKMTEGTKSLQVKYRIDNCFIGYLEHVTLRVEFKFLWRQHSSIVLVSPLGMESRMLRERKYDRDSSTVEWTFMSVHTWGEKPVGEWTLKFLSSERENVMILYSWKLDLYGTVTNPLDGVQSDGVTGGFCNATAKCSNSNICLENENICIDCSNGFHVIDRSCIRDGIESGYCGASVKCIDQNNGCNATSNQCVHCGLGYHVIGLFCIEEPMATSRTCISIEKKSEICIQHQEWPHPADRAKKLLDGTLNGYCNYTITCKDAGAGCQRNSSVCVNCTNGSRIINTFCIRDGSIGGHCDEDIHCMDDGVGCDLNTSVCVICNSGSHIINFTCIEDGTLNGHCNLNSPCKIVNVGCDLQRNICVNCDKGSRKIRGICIEDGAPGGYCSSNIPCTDTDTGCDNSNDVCVICRNNSRIIKGFCIQDGTFGGYCSKSIECTDEVLQCSNNTCLTAEKEQDGITSEVIGIVSGSVAGAIAIGSVAAAIRKRDWIKNKIWPEKSKDSTTANSSQQLAQEPLASNLTLGNINPDLSSNNFKPSLLL